MYDLQFEKFKDVYDFDNKINSRSDNKVMEGEKASQKHDSWSGTSTYEEAEKLLQKGWSAKVDEMKEELKKYSATVERLRVKNKPNIAGFAPIVPSAIRGVPKAMWTQERKIINTKKRTLHIYFNNTGSACEDAEDLMKSGMTVLKLCILLEKKGIKVKLDILPFVAINDNSVYGCGIAIKDYQQPFNLQKMAYPIAHTAIFRRQGFKWLETMENCTNYGFHSGYGRPLRDDGKIEEEFKKKFKLNEEGSVYITYYDCKDSGFDADTLAKNKNIKVEVIS